MNPFFVFLLFVKYSAFCFGGGYILIPLLNADLVGAPPRLLTPELFARYISIAQVTPGPVFINVATFVGYLQSGFWGALGATLGAVLLSVPLVVLAIRLLKKYEASIWVKGFFRGMRPASFGLILAAAWIFLEMSALSAKVPWMEFARISEIRINWVAVGIFALSFAVLSKTKISLTALLAAAAVAGALLCR